MVSHRGVQCGRSCDKPPHSKGGRSREGRNSGAGLAAAYSGAAPAGLRDDLPLVRDSLDVRARPTGFLDQFNACLATLLRDRERRLPLRTCQDPESQGSIEHGVIQLVREG